MGQRKMIRRIKHSVCVCAPAECVWRHITDVDIASFRHPAYLSVLGLPKPLRAEVIEAGVGGRRVAYFDNGKRFTQEITVWNPLDQYAFTFQADPGFRVGHVLDLAEGPFRMRTGTYTLSVVAGGIRLQLESQYELRGVRGVSLIPPVWLVLSMFQKYLLRGIKANAERENAEGEGVDRN